MAAFVLPIIRSRCRVYALSVHCSVDICLQLDTVCCIIDRFMYVSVAVSSVGAAGVQLVLQALCTAS